MAYKMVFDHEKCQGYANCMLVAPDIWDFDEETNKAVLINEFPSEEQRAHAEESERDCPSGAISIEEV
jgi:ferredoxin